MNCGSIGGINTKNIASRIQPIHNNTYYVYPWVEKVLLEPRFINTNRLEDEIEFNIYLCGEGGIEQEHKFKDDSDGMRS